MIRLQRSRLSARRASRSVRPSARRRARYARAGSYMRACVSTMRCSARLSRRLPPRFTRWRVTPALEASSGATPASAASCSSPKPGRGAPSSATIVQAVSAPTPSMALRARKELLLARSSLRRRSRICASSSATCSAVTRTACSRSRATARAPGATYARAAAMPACVVRSGRAVAYLGSHSSSRSCSRFSRRVRSSVSSASSRLHSCTDASSSSSAYTRGSVARSSRSSCATLVCVKAIALARATHAPAALRGPAAIDLVDLLAVLGQELRQTTAQVPGTFDRPDALRPLCGPLEQLRPLGRVVVDASRADHSTLRDRHRLVQSLVGVDADPDHDTAPSGSELARRRRSTGLTWVNRRSPIRSDRRRRSRRADDHSREGQLLPAPPRLRVSLTLDHTMTVRRGYRCDEPPHDDEQ